MGVNKFDQVHLSSLKNGDRFYIGSNKAKVFEFLRKEKPNFNAKYTYYYSDGINEILSKADKVVIFLRNIND